MDAFSWRRKWTRRLFLKIRTLVSAAGLWFQFAHRPQLKRNGPLWLAALPLIAADNAQSKKNAGPQMERIVKSLWSPHGNSGSRLRFSLHYLRSDVPACVTPPHMELLPAGLGDVAARLLKSKGRLAEKHDVKNR